VTDPDLKELLEPIRALTSLFAQSGHPGMILGGVAAGIWGRSRPTVDVDGMILATFADLPDLLQKAGEVGLRPRNPDPIAFAKRNRILLLKHEASGKQVDLSLGEYPFEVECVERSKEITVEDVSFPVASPEDLIIYKAVAGRPRDLEDIEMVLRTQLDLDLNRIEFWAKQFANGLAIPEIFTTLDALLKKVKGQTKPFVKKKSRRKSGK